MSVSREEAKKIHPLPVPAVCPYECCGPMPTNGYEVVGAVPAGLGRSTPLTSFAVTSQHRDQLTPALPAALSASASGSGPQFLESCPALGEPFAANGMHCPSLEPLEGLVADRRRDGWVPDFDAVEAGVAVAMACGTCGGRLCYLALAPAAGAPATAWGICVTCRHWVQL